MSGKDEHAYKIEFNTAIHQIKIEYTHCTLGIARYGNYIHYTACVICKMKSNFAFLLKSQPICKFSPMLLLWLEL